MTDALLGTTGWVISGETIGQSPITSTIAAPTTTANMGTVAAGTISSTPGSAGRSVPGKLGQIVKAYHPTWGQGEFIRLLGVASTVAGLMVTYNATTFQTTLSPNTAQNAAPVAVAMSANVANQWGWYMIEGLATVLKTAVQVLPGAKIFQSGTAGRVFATSTAGMQILGAKGANLTTVTSTTSTVVVLLNRPSMQGHIT